MPGTIHLRYKEELLRSKGLGQCFSCPLPSQLSVIFIRQKSRFLMKKEKHFMFFTSSCTETPSLHCFHRQLPVHFMIFVSFCRFFFAFENIRQEIDFSSFCTARETRKLLSCNLGESLPYGNHNVCFAIPLLFVLNFHSNLFQFLGPYSVSKTALLGLVKAMAGQCAQKNIRVNGIAPGIIQTNFSSAVRTCKLFRSPVI